MTMTLKEQLDAAEAKKAADWIEYEAAEAKYNAGDKSLADRIEYEEAKAKYIATL